MIMILDFFFFFFQAEDGIRDVAVTGVQTCALPICYALQSQQRTARAQQEGFFKEELAPMHVTRGVLDKKTGEVVGKEEWSCDKDECNRPDTTLEGLLTLPPHFDKESGQGTVTAGNSSQLSDGASATLVMSMERAKALRIRPKLVFRGFPGAGF